MVRWYNGYYIGLSIRRCGFDSRTNRHKVFSSKGQDTGLSIRRCEFESREDHHHALLTQWAEYSSDTRAVRGSNPRGRTIQPFNLTAGCRTLIPEA